MGLEEALSGLHDTASAKQAVALRSASDGLDFDCLPGESVLEAALRAGLPMAHACGGKARCSTCRVWLTSGGNSAPPPGEAEARLKETLHLGPEIRLACQLRPERPLTFRRLVIDKTDFVIANQLNRRQPAQAGEIRKVAVMFFDIASFTALTSRLPPYDVMFLMNKFLAQVGRILERRGGYFDKAIGDGFLAIFGARGREAAGLRAVAAALEILRSVALARPLTRRLYGIEFAARIGIHYGEALIGDLGPPGAERLTVIGEVANIANRVEQANKEVGTSLLITEELYAEVRDEVVSPDFVRVLIPGVQGRRTLYEVTGLTPAARRRIASLAAHPSSDVPSRSWTRLLDSGDLPEGAVRIVPHPRLYIGLTRQRGRVLAFNNHCPHMRLPFFGPEIPDDGRLPPTPAESEISATGAITCRFHGTVFDLETGRIASWCPALAADGTSPGLEVLGDLSRNEAPLEVFRCREFKGAVWVEL